MKKLLTSLFLACILIAASAQKFTPFGYSVTFDTTLGTASSEAFVLPQKFNSYAQAFYVISPALVGADSIESTAYIYEMNAVGSTAYGKVIGRSASIAQKTTFTPVSLFDTVSGYQQELYFTSSIDSSAAIYSIYAWYRPQLDPDNLDNQQYTGAVQLLTDANSVTFSAPMKLPNRYEVAYVVKVKKNSGTTAGSILIQEAADITGTAYATMTTTALTNATANYFIEAKNQGVRTRVKITGTGTQNDSIWVYAVAKPVRNKNQGDLVTLFKTFASQTLTDAGTINFALSNLVSSLYDCEYVVKVTKASGTVAGTIYLQDAADNDGSAYGSQITGVTLADATANYVLVGKTYGKRQRISVVGSGTQSATVIVYAILKPKVF